MVRRRRVRPEAPVAKVTQGGAEVPGRYTWLTAWHPTTANVPKGQTHIEVDIDLGLEYRFARVERLVVVGRLIRLIAVPTLVAWREIGKGRWNLLDLHRLPNGTGRRSRVKEQSNASV